MISATALASLALLVSPLAPPTAPALIHHESPRPLFALGYRPLDRGEFAQLRAGAPAASIVIDLPLRGCVTVHVSKASLITDDFTLECAKIVKERVVTTQSLVELPHAYEGRVEGCESSRVYLGFGSATASGLVVGCIDIDGDRWWLSSGSDASRRAGLPAMIAHDSTLAAQSLEGMACMANSLAENGSFGEGNNSADGGLAGGAGCREYRVAVDTDTEFTMTAHAGNTVAASQYALLLMGAASQVYNSDLNARLPLSYLRLWTGEDPWTQTEMGAQLNQYRDYWQANMSAVPRDIGHHLNGRGLGGGVAWVGVTCAVPEWAYALSSGIGYGFPYPLVDHDHGNWEPMVVMHEIGHNFGAPHTHDHTPPADGCGSGDCTLAWEGTIMSYCHGCAGGMSNVSLRFHPYSLASINAHLAGTQCNDAGVKAVDDAASTIEGMAVTILPLTNDAFVNCSVVRIATVDAASANGGSIVLADGASPTFTYTPAAQFSGVDSFTYKIIDSTNAVSLATVYVTVRPILDQTFLLSPALGMPARWYALTGDTTVLPDFAALTPYGSDVLANINIVSTNGNFSTSGRPDYVAAVFEGYILIPTTGVWNLSTESDDGSKLYVDGQLIVNNDGLHGMVDRTGQVAVEAGYHLYRVEFFENGGGAGEIARWEGPGVARAVIPASAFRKMGVVMQIDLNGDGTVAAADLSMLLARWGAASASEPADFDRNGAVGASDLSLLLSAWGQ